MKPAVARNPGDKLSASAEELIDLRFTVHKITPRAKPQEPKRNIIIPCFAEFGSEVIATMYCIPRLAQICPGHYKTAIGWHGREYLYRHLVDEFWELSEDQMYLREYSRAFHHDSENLRKFEDQLKGTGIVVSSDTMGRIALGTQCNGCWRYWPETSPSEQCGFCGSKDLRRSLYSNIRESKLGAVLPPKPSAQKLEFAKRLVGKRPVGIFARARKCYGRNLPSAFYEALIIRLRRMGYDPIWMGEKSTTLACPVEDVIDFSRMDESRDLETTFAIASLCEFTVQFWTASTRIAAMVGTPYLLFESPDQMWGSGQEGYRLDLATVGKRKLVASHYLNVLQDQAAGIDLVERCVEEMGRGDFRDVIGMVENPSVVLAQKKSYAEKQFAILG